VALSTKELWEREYGASHIIPSTMRIEPSRGLLLFSEILDYSRFRRVLDAGSGNGRNAIYLAKKGCEVHCVDFCNAAITSLRETVRAAKLERSIHVYGQSLLEALPFPDLFFDAVVDVYTFCHFFGEERVQYLSQIQRIAQSNGYLIMVTMTPDDGYYGPMLGSQRAGEAVVRDPFTGIKKHLYTESELEEQVSPYFDVVKSALLTVGETVRGRSYERRVLTLVTRKRT
jgi:cyclopropane fatty-acyl-phospholipid synthase-like methyltransferase